MTLPDAVYSQLGPVPVRVTEKIKGGGWGMFFYGERRIEVLRAQTEESRLATLAHEMVHVALYDSGIEEGLTKETLEAICNAVGTYVAAAALAGYLEVKAP